MGIDGFCTIGVALFGECVVLGNIVLCNGTIESPLLPQ